MHFNENFVKIEKMILKLFKMDLHIKIASNIVKIIQILKMKNVSTTIAKKLKKMIKITVNLFRYVENF